MNSILVVEDDIIINGGICLFLEKQGYQVASALSMAEAEDLLEKGYTNDLSNGLNNKHIVNKFDLVLLDINLPDGSGLDLCTKIRETSGIFIIFLTSNDTEENMIEGFNYGCDDYISKPFSLEILGQRIKAVLRRGSIQQENNQCFSYKGLSVDFKKMSVTENGIPVKLSSTEFKLLSCLIENKGQVLTRTTLLEKIWDCDANFVDENTLSVYIRRLRQKLEPDHENPIYIITVFGIGYTFGE